MDYRTLVSCGSGLEAYYGGDGERFMYAEVDVTLNWAMAELRSLRRLFTLILVNSVLTIFKHIAYCVLLLDWKSGPHKY